MAEPQKLNPYPDHRIGTDADEWVRGLGGDAIFFGAGVGHDTLDGGEGTDTVVVDFGGAGAGVAHAFSTGAVAIMPHGSVTLIDVENVALAGASRASGSRFCGHASSSGRPEVGHRGSM